MSDETEKVTVVSFGPTRPLMLRWIDPATHERKFKSARTRNRREAERKAALLQKDLEEGKAANSPRMPWQRLRIEVHGSRVARQVGKHPAASRNRVQPP